MLHWAPFFVLFDYIRSGPDAVRARSEFNNIKKQIELAKRPPHRGLATLHEPVLVLA